MKQCVALAAAAVVFLPACQDSAGPREIGLVRADRPMFDHVSHSFAIAYQSL